MPDQTLGVGLDLGLGRLRKLRSGQCTTSKIRRDKLASWNEISCFWNNDERPEFRLAWHLLNPENRRKFCCLVYLDDFQQQVIVPAKTREALDLQISGGLHRLFQPNFGLMRRFRQVIVDVLLLGKDNGLDACMAVWNPEMQLADRGKRWVCRFLPPHDVCCDSSSSLLQKLQYVYVSMRCPECHRSLEQFSIACSNCGWSLAKDIEAGESTLPRDEAVSTSYDLHYGSAIELLETDEYPAALRAINRALATAQLDQKNESLAVRGYINFKLGEHVRAISDCNEAIDAGWMDSRTFSWRAAALAAENRWSEVFDDLNEAMKLAGSDHERYHQLVMNYLPQATTYFSGEIKKYPESSLLFRQLAWVYFRAGVYDKAEKAFYKSLKFDDKDFITWVGLANVLLALGKFKLAVIAADKALFDPLPRTKWNALECRVRANHARTAVIQMQRDLENLKKLAGNDAKRNLLIGQVKLDIDDPAGALIEFKAVVERYPGNMLALLLRATAYCRLNNHSMAVVDYSSYLRLRPTAHNVMLLRAKSLLELQDYDRAIDDATMALHLEHKNIDAHLTRATVFHARQQFDKAMTDVEFALRIDDRNSLAYAVRGKTNVGLCQFSSAVDDFSRAIECSEKAPAEERAEYFYSRGTTLYELKQFEPAAADFEQAVQLQPNHAGAFVWLAAVRSQLGEWDVAIAHLQRATTVKPAAARQYLLFGRTIATEATEYFAARLDSKPQDVSHYLSRGLAHQFLGNADAAISDFTVVLEKIPDDFETRTRRGQLLQKQKLHARAIKDFTYVIHRQDENHWARFCRAVSWVAENKLDHAMSDLFKAIKTSPAQPKYHILRGEVASKRRHVAKAIRAFNRAELLCPVDPLPARLRGIANVSLGKFRIAIDDLTRSLDLKSDQADVYAYRGQAYLKTKKIEAARLDFDKAVRLNPNAVKAFVGRAEVLAAQDELHEAVLWLTKSLHRFPEHRRLAELLLARGKVFYQMGRYPQAVGDFTSVLELVRQDHQGQYTARYARALAWIQSEEFESAQRDLEKIRKLKPDRLATVNLLRWLTDRNGPKPPELVSPPRIFKLVKPKITRAPVRLNGSSGEFAIHGPFDTWIVRDAAKDEYGPVSKQILDKWIEQGRIVAGMRVLRSDWSRWKKAEKVYTELLD